MHSSNLRFSSGVAGEAHRIPPGGERASEGLDLIGELGLSWHSVECALFGMTIVILARCYKRSNVLCCCTQYIKSIISNDRWFLDGSFAYLA